MRRLPLYASDPVAAIEAEASRGLDAACTRCELHQGARTVCISAEGEPGGLLVIGEGPGRDEDAAGRPFIGSSGRLLRNALSAWKGPIAIDNAIRCFPKGTEVAEKHMEACRGYLAATLREVQPTRVVALGAWAAKALVGRPVAPFTSRRAYTYLYGTCDEPVPVFFVLHPAAALRNRFVREWFDADLRWALTCAAPPAAPILSQIRLVENAHDAAVAVAELSAAEWAAFDIESCGIMYDSSYRLLSLSACAMGSSSAWVWSGESLADAGARAALIRWLEDPHAKKLGQNVQYDVNAIALTLGAQVRGLIGDTRLWRKLVEPEAEGKLDKMVELVGMGGTKEEAKRAMNVLVERVRKGLMAEKRIAANRSEDAALIASGGRPKKRAPIKQEYLEGALFLRDLDVADPVLATVVRNPNLDTEAWSYGLLDRENREQLLRYNARDSVSTARLGVQQNAAVVAVPPVDRVRRLVVDRAARAITHVERWGIAADVPALRAFDSHLETGLKVVRARLDACAGADFNPGSGPQVAELLFNKLGLAPRKITKTGKHSTDADVLEELKLQHPVAADISEWRHLSKLRGTYALGMLDHVRPDGRIHTTILLDGARSGRTSSSNPNLQNIPRSADSIEGKMARDVFVASPGHVLVSLDYSQIELRVAAALSQDPVMMAIFISGEDFHQRTAEMVSRIAWGIPPEKVEKKHRSQAKIINFRALYGGGATTLAADLGCTVKEAEKIQEAILGKFRILEEWIQECINYTRKTGLTWTWWDGERARRRPMWPIADQDDKRRNVAENGAFNTPVQGTANEFCVASMASSTEWILEEGLEDVVKLVLPVHDQLLFDVREDFVDETIRVARSIMLSWDCCGVPLVVDAETGPSWGSLVKYKEAA